MPGLEIDYVLANPLASAGSITTDLAKLLANWNPRAVAALMPTISEPQLLILLGCGLMVFANLVRRYSPFTGDPFPKSYHVIVAIAPSEISEYLDPSEHSS